MYIIIIYVYTHIGAKTRISRARKHGATALDRPWGRHTRRTSGRHRSGQRRNVKWAPRWEARTRVHSLSVPGKLLVTLLTGKRLVSCVARKCEVTHEPRDHESASCGEARTCLHSRFDAGKMLVAYVTGKWEVTHESWDDEWAPCGEAGRRLHSLSIAGKVLESYVARKCKVTHEPRDDEWAPCGEVGTRLHSLSVTRKWLVTNKMARLLFCCLARVWHELAVDKNLKKIKTPHLPHVRCLDCQSINFLVTNAA